MIKLAVRDLRPLWSVTVAVLVFCGGASLANPPPNAETQERSRIAAANLEDAIVVDCQLPGKLQKLGGTRTYLTPGVVLRLSAVDCRARGGEYTIGDLSSGTLSLQRWLPLAQNGQAEAQYYVARIYANGMGGVDADYKRAAEWYQKASGQNYSAATQELGYMYEQGLGVPKDTKLALNMQRKAAGLGDELDYAWKITAAQEEGARQAAALSAQLDASNGEVESLRGQLRDTSNAVLQSRAELTKSESALLDLREQLASAKQTPSNGKELSQLESSLAAKEKELTAAQEQMGSLTAQLQQQQSQLSARMAESQVSSLELNELLTGEQAKTKSLEGRLAQADQRLLRSQQELAELRTQYRAEVQQLVAEREDIQRAEAKSKDEVQALLSARERELTRQQSRVALLEKALADMVKQTQAGAKVNTAKDVQSTAQTEQQRASIAALRAQIDEQQRQLKQRQDELTALRSQSSQEKEAAVRSMADQLNRRDSELEAKQRRLTALASETDALRGEVTRLSAQREKDVAGVTDEATRARASLRLVQQKLSEQRERIDQLQVEKATETAALVRARDELQRQLTANRQASQAQIGFLSKDLQARQKDIESKDGEIARLEARLQEQSREFRAMMAQSRPGSGGPLLADASVGPPAVGVKMRSADSRPNPMRDSVRELREQSAGNYHALVIGNSLYHYMEPLDTPANDAKEIAGLLEQRYGFEVKLLLDATREQIMTALHDQTLKLTPQDSLLIYYAGHGDVSESGDRAFWLGVEADRDTRAGWLEADHIRAKVKEMRAKHVLLVADSCFSGAITHPKTTTIGRGLNETRLRVQWNRRARMVLTSGEVTPVADSGGGASHSIFARYFIQVLRQNDNIMSGEMLSHELSARMLAKPIPVGRNGQQQTPTYSALHDANHDMGDFFFVPAVETAQVAALNY